MRQLFNDFEWSRMCGIHTLSAATRAARPRRFRRFTYQKVQRPKNTHRPIGKNRANDEIVRDRHGEDEGARNRGFDYQSNPPYQRHESHVSAKLRTFYAEFPEAERLELLARAS